MKLNDLLNKCEMFTKVTVLQSKSKHYTPDYEKVICKNEYLRNVFDENESIKNYFDYDVIGVRVAGGLMPTLEITIYKGEKTMKITKELYKTLKAAKETGQNLCEVAHKLGLIPDDTYYGYGVYGGKIKEENGEYYFSYEREDSCE